MSASPIPTASVPPSPSPTPSATATPLATPTPAPTASSSATPTASPPPAISGFVQRNGAILTLNGQPYRFTGLNIYNANSRDNCWYSLGYNDGALASTLNAIGPGEEVFRAWFFQRMATTNGARDWAAFDHTLAVARASGQRVLAVLANQWGDCEDEPAGIYKTNDWYASGYRSVVTSGTVPYRDWVREVVSRYSGDPTIFAWELMNEPENKITYPDGSCGPADTLRTWAADVSGLVRSIDARHLISLGTIGSGQCGARQTEYQTLHAISTVDLCSYHDYDLPDQPLPGDQWNGFLTRVAQCATLGKPVFVGESGIKTADVGTTAVRATDFSAKVAAELSAGAVGWLAWAWRDGPHGGSSAGYDIGPGDPTLGLLLQY